MDEGIPSQMDARSEELFWDLHPVELSFLPLSQEEELADSDVLDNGICNTPSAYI